MREQVEAVVRFWMKKGVKGFRFDVVNLISKGSYEDDYEGDGRRFYTDGPNIHRYLQELNEKTFGTDRGIVTVGEMSSTSMENCFRYASEDGKELSMVFSFHHLKVDFAGNEKWVLVPYDFQKLKKILFDWQSGMAEHCAWNAVFWCNHDQPRVVSRFGDEGKYWKQSAKMLGTVIHCLRGTPYVYQGEELGMTNTDFTDISQYRDVESINYYRILQEKGLRPDDAFRIIQIHSRDNGRTPMQWNAEKNAGFTMAEQPWIGVNANHAAVNAQAELADEDSIFRHYQKLIRLRKELDVIAYGDFTPVDQKNARILAYKRTHEGHALLVVNNFYGRPEKWTCPEDLEGFSCVLSNYPDSRVEKEMELRPFESVVLYR